MNILILAVFACFLPHVMLIFLFYLLNWSANSKVSRDLCCLYVGICFDVAPHHMPDHVVTLAWHMRPHKMRSHIRELTCEACNAYILRGLGANVWIFLGMDLCLISPLYITFRFDTYMEHLNICRMHF